MQAIRGKSFFLNDDTRVIFEATAKRLPANDWRFGYAGDIIAREDVVSATDSIAERLDAAATCGEYDRVEMILVNPVMTLLLLDEGTLTYRHFKQAQGISLCYFDLPGAEFAGYVKPVRVAQFPSCPATLTDARGYPTGW